MSQHYSKAPIAEAVISLRIDPQPGFDLAALQKLADQLPAFSKRSPIKNVQMSFSGAHTPNPAFHGAHEEVGIRLEAQDGRRVLMLQKQEFTFSHLPPYSSWREFSAEGKQLWPAFVTSTGARHVTRAAVRVINKLELPSPIGDLPHYVNLLPMLPRNMPSPPETFFMQFQLALDRVEKGCRAVVNVASSSVGGKAASNVLLDFDLFVQGHFDVGNDTIWPLLDRLSDGKNQLFEACITDQTRILIQ